MAELIHESYRKVFQEMQNEHLRDLQPKVTEHFFTPPVYFPPVSEKKEVSAKMFGFIGIVIGVMLTLSGNLILARYQKTVQAVAEVTPYVLPIQKDEAQALRADMELTKKILTGLVQSVQTLSVSSEAKLHVPSEVNEFPYPVRVTTETASLMERPGVGGKALVTVRKDSVLLAMEEKEGWIRVSTPKGEDAWVGIDMVKRKG